MRRRRGRALLLLLAALAGCGRCGTRSAAPVERHLPAGSAVILAPRLGDASADLAALATTLGRFPIAAGVRDRRAAIAAQLGFDPLDARGLEAAGLDPDGAAALARTPAGWIAALPARDPDRLHETLARLARDRLGAALRVAAPLDGVPVVSFATAAGAPPSLSYALVGGVALLGQGPGGPAAISRAARLGEPDSLAASGPWKTARAALPRRAAVVAFAPPGAWPATALAPLRDGAAAALSARDASLELTAAVLLPPARLDAWRAVAGSGEEDGAADLQRLPRDAFLAARFGGDPAALTARLLAWVPGEERAALAEVERELAAALAPGAAFSLSLAPTFDFTAFSRGRGPTVAAAPFRFVHLAAVARVRDEAAGRRLLDALARAAPALGLAAEAGEPGALALARGEAEARLALRGDRLLVAGGAGRLEELERLAGGGRGFAAPTEAAADLAAGGFAAAVLDPGALVRGARALPEAAFGAGPDKFVMRSVADRVLDPASRIEAAALRIELTEGAARIAVRAGARPDAAVRP
jgi:hypothetical protein